MNTVTVGKNAVYDFQYGDDGRDDDDDDDDENEKKNFSVV